MPVKLKPASQIKARLGIEPNGKVQKFFTHTCAVHMDKYVPFDTGTLASSVDEEPNAVIYEQQYAEVVYYGMRNGKPIKIHTDKHAQASTYWDRQMVSAEINDVVKEVQNFVEGKK